MTSSNRTMNPSDKRPIVLIVRDGWGRNPHREHDTFNAIKLAHTPRGDALLREYPWTLIHTSGEEVGLPEGTMGNSEVGHQNLGAGRVVYQESVRITRAVRSGEFYNNEVLVTAVKRAVSRQRMVHLLGIASDAGVHGLLDHLYGCVELCKRLGLPAEKVALHLFTDGRDTGPFTGRDFISRIEAQLRTIGVGQIASIVGRYYAMDRDNRWERVEKAYHLLTSAKSDDTTACPNFATAEAAMQDYYDHPTNDSQNGDEFITPRTVGNRWRDTRVADGDTVIFYNYRGDRPREITRAFVMPEFHGHVKPSPDTGEKGFQRGPKLDLEYVCMTEYDTSLSSMVKVAYPKLPPMRDIAGEYLSGLGLRQFRCAETEKFPHVTFFFNDYREAPFPGESRQMAQSPSVATYDLKPEMSASEVCEIVLRRLAAPDCEDFILVNFANGDMVGHTGKLDAAIKAVETVDGCVGRIVDATLGRGGALIVTADHGNAEQMWDPQTNAPHTAHTTYDVECIVVDPRLKKLASGNAESPSTGLRHDARLADVFPTILMMLGLTKPAAMEGASIVC